MKKLIVNIYSFYLLWEQNCWYGFIEINIGHFQQKHSRQVHVDILGFIYREFDSFRFPANKEIYFN